MNYLVSLLLLLLSCSRYTQNIKISPLHPYMETRDTAINGRRSFCKWKYFVVSGANIKDSADLATLRRFAIKQLDSNYRGYSQFEVVFFKRTSVINETYRSAPKRDLGWYGDDRIVEFHWLFGHPSEMLLEEGKVLNSRVTITDHPPVGGGG
jgi:hypothetical protein